MFHCFQYLKTVANVLPRPERFEGVTAPTRSRRLSLFPSHQPGRGGWNIPLPLPNGDFGLIPTTGDVVRGTKPRSYSSSSENRFV
jgi:hypothetical protein